MFLIEVSQTWLDKRSKKRNGEKLFVEGAFSKLFNELETETWLPKHLIVPSAYSLILEEN